VTPPREAIDGYLAAFNAHDSAGLLAGLAPDAVWITGQDSAVGRAALAELFDDWLWSLDPHLEATRLAVDGDTAAAELLESITVDGQRREYSIAAFFTVADGVITRAKIYREGTADIDQ
jgi:ketosteroid isomerase-like protein